MKKLIMISILLVISAPAVGLKYPDNRPGFYCCMNSGWVIWEFIDDGCMPTSDEYDPPYRYYPDLDNPAFGSRHWDDPTDDSGWGGSYGADLWTYEDGAFTVLAEDSLNQPIPERGGKPYLRQYFEVVHTLVPGLSESDYRWPIGLGMEIWDMSAEEYPPDGWTGCPVGYEGLSGDGYRGGYEFVGPEIHYEIEGAPGWYKSVWIHDFSQDGTVYSGEYEEEFDALFEATHTACIIGMDFVPDEGEIFQVEEVTLDFIWFTNPDRSDIPTTWCCCCPPPPPPPIRIEPNPIYEPMDMQVVGPPYIKGPTPNGPTEGEVLVHLAWQPSYMVGEVEVDYDTFTVTVVLDPNPNSEDSGNADFDVTDPVPPDPNQNVTLTFTEADWQDDQAVTLTAIGDTEIEGNEAHTIEFTITTDVDDPNFGGPGYDPVVVTKSVVVVDNDLPFVSANPYEFNLSEHDAPDTTCFGVRLSHLPEDGATIYVYVVVDGPEAIAIDPNFVQFPPYGEPNRLTFLATNEQPFNEATMTSSWHVPQTICVGVNDDDELVEEWLRYPEGEIIFTPFSEDIRYLVDWLNPDGSEVEDDPCTTAEETSDGIGVETFLSVTVEDNECGAWGYDYRDVNHDCYVNLGDAALVYSQWLMCTYPYDGDVWGIIANTWDECAPSWELFEEE